MSRAACSGPARVHRRAEAVVGATLSYFHALELFLNETSGPKISKENKTRRTL